MKTAQLWLELMQKASLLDPSDKQLSAMHHLAHIAISTTPVSVDGIAQIEKDIDGDLVIQLQEAKDGQPVVNGTWGRLVIETDGWVTLTGTGIDNPMCDLFA